MKYYWFETVSISYHVQMLIMTYVLRGNVLSIVKYIDHYFQEYFNVRNKW